MTARSVSPTSPPSPAAGSAGSGTRTVTGTPDHVLVVDDSKQNRMVASGHLKAAGYRVTSVGSGEEALVELAAERVDLVVLDVLMPGLGGFATCRRIRDTPALVDVPVLFLTALGDQRTSQPALEAGGDDLLAKPFNHAELLLRVRALIRQRRQAQRVAAQNAALRRISQMIVHDLRGPTAAIVGNIDMLLVDGGLAGEPLEAAVDIATAASHLDRTIRDLLDLSTAEDIGLEATLAPCDAGELIAEAAAALRGAGRYKGLHITWDVRVPTLVVDRELVQRMLQNLVHNAIKHAPVRSRIVIDVGRDDGGVLVRVLDEGPGVKPADAERIFERYVSAGSHGLGLAFCRLVAELHGGRIWVEPRQPRGAVFCVQLPAAKAGVTGRLKTAPIC
ncbi:MAG TPA: hybrid sensor histidine kinase/response regulator [Kofleriaceae bacterium]|nr:hybrid sensor histidine kinase/response regulator [Kofleriaceae bacterium]